MDDLKLPWYDEEGPYKDCDVITKSEYDLPAPYGGTGSNTILVFISSDQRDEACPDACLLVLSQAIGEGFWSRTFLTVETAKKAAEMWMKELVRRVTEPAE